MAMASPMFAMRIKRIILDRSDSSTVEAAAVAAGSADRSETAMSGVSSTAGAAAGSDDGVASPSFPSQEGCWSAMIILQAYYAVFVRMYSTQKVYDRSNALICPSVERSDRVWRFAPHAQRRRSATSFRHARA